MRKRTIILILTILTGIGAFAQSSVELVPTAGYTFASHTDFYSNYGRIEDGLNLGGSINFNFSRSFGIEVLYSHMAASSGIYNYGDAQKVSGGNVNLDYIMAGPVTSFSIPNSTVRPFIGFLLGAAILTPDANSGATYTTSDSRFAAGFQLGTNIYFSPRFGIQLKGQVLAPVDGAIGGFYFSNYGAGAGINTYSSTYQFSLSGGLIIGLGKVLQDHPRGPAGHYRPAPRYYRYYY